MIADHRRRRRHRPRRRARRGGPRCRTGADRPHGRANSKQVHARIAALNKAPADDCAARSGARRRARLRPARRCAAAPLRQARRPAAQRRYPRRALADRAVRRADLVPRAARQSDRRIRSDAGAAAGCCAPRPMRRSSSPAAAPAGTRRRLLGRLRGVEIRHRGPEPRSGRGVRDAAATRASTRSIPGPVRTRLRRQAYPAEDIGRLAAPEDIVPPYLWLLGAGQSWRHRPAPGLPSKAVTSAASSSRQ